MADDIDKLLGRTDYVEHWLREARYHGKGRVWQLHLVEAVAILEGAFGREWLHEIAKQPNRAMLTADDPSRHPLGYWIATPSPSHVASVVELAVYLRRCAPVPKVNDLLPMLRNARQFGRAFVQLAFGYRFLKLGVSNLEFEPSTDGGRRADHLFVSNGTPYLVECYEPEEDRHPVYSDLINHSPSAICDAANHFKRRVIAQIEVDSFDVLDAPKRKAIERDARNLISQLTDGGTEISGGTGYAVRVMDTVGRSSDWVETLAKSLARPGDWVVNHGFVPRAQVAGIPRGEPRDHIRLSWVVVTIKNKPDPMDELSELARKVDNKVSQVRRRAERAKGIILVKSWLGRSGGLGKPGAIRVLNDIKSRVLLGHSDLAGVLVIERAHDQEDRPYFGGVWLEGRDGAPLAELFERLRQNESARGVLDDWS